MSISSLLYSQFVLCIVLFFNLNDCLLKLVLEILLLGSKSLITISGNVADAISIVLLFGLKCSPAILFLFIFMIYVCRNLLLVQSAIYLYFELELSISLFYFLQWITNHVILEFSFLSNPSYNLRSKCRYYKFKTLKNNNYIISFYLLVLKYPLPMIIHLKLSYQLIINYHHFGNFVYGLILPF